MRGAARAAAFATAWLVSVSPGAAQSWVPPRGEGSVTIAYQTIDNTGHIDAAHVAVSGGRSRDMSMYAEVEYALTDRVSVAIGVPFVLARYEGPPPPNLPLLANDRCHCWQHGWQDVGVTGRYNILNGATALTPSISVGVPSHDYPYRGEAVVGRHLREVRLALDAGRRLEVISPRLAVEAGYSYAFVERVIDLPNNRSNASVTLSVLAGRSVSLQVSATGQITHGGLRVFGPPGAPDGIPWGEITTSEELQQHDRLLRDDNWRLGGGVSYHTKRADLSVSYLRFMDGENTHEGQAITLGITLPFATRDARP
jgi:hypothetical protein